MRLRAAALGTPIVSTPVDGLKDLISNDITGYLSDDNQKMADVIIRYLNDTDKLNELSTNQLKSAKEWNDNGKYFSELNKVYLDVLKR